MKAVILPGFSELIIKVDPTGEVTRKGLLKLMMPWLYAPWPEAKETGVIDLEFAGDTLKDLLIDIGRRYQKAGVDFKPFDEESNQLDFDYDVFVNDKNYLTLPSTVESKLKPDDEVKIKVMWRWDG